MLTFGLPPIADLGARLRVMASVSAKPVQFMIDPNYLRQVAARLDRVAVLEAQVSTLSEDLGDAQRLHEHLAGKILTLEDRATGLRSRCVGLLLWNIGWFTVAAMAIATTVAFGVWR